MVKDRYYNYFNFEIQSSRTESYVIFLINLQAAGGTFSAAVSIVTHATGGDPVNSALIFFCTACVVTVLALLAYLSLYLLVSWCFLLTSFIRQLLLCSWDYCSHCFLHYGGLGCDFFSFSLVKHWVYKNV